MARSTPDSQAPTAQSPAGCAAGLPHVHQNAGADGVARVPCRPARAGPGALKTFLAGHRPVLTPWHYTYVREVAASD